MGTTISGQNPAPATTRGYSPEPALVAKEPATDPHEETTRGYFEARGSVGDSQPPLHGSTPQPGSRGYIPNAAPEFGSLSRGSGPQTSGNAERDKAVVDDAAGAASKAVYGKNGDTFTSGGPLPEDKRTWNKVSDAELQQMGLDPALFKDTPNVAKVAGVGVGSTGYKAALYKSDRGEYILAYAGTNPKSGKDVWTDVKGGLTPFTPAQFDRAMETGKAVKAKLGDNVVFTGHSLGGGLASYAAIGTGTPATLFNPMDLTRNLISKARSEAKTNAPDSAYANTESTWKPANWGGVGNVVKASQHPNQGMRQYVAKGELLDGAQSGVSSTSGKPVKPHDPTAYNDVGQKIPVTGDKPGGTVEKHSLDYTRPAVAKHHWNEYAKSAPAEATDQQARGQNSSLSGYYPAPTPGAGPTTPAPTAKAVPTPAAPTPVVDNNPAPAAVAPPTPVAATDFNPAPPGVTPGPPEMYADGSAMFVTTTDDQGVSTTTQVE
jgi:hypothetical protein